MGEKCTNTDCIYYATEKCEEIDGCPGLVTKKCSNCMGYSCTGICVNGDSEYVGEDVDPCDVCEMWEE